MVKKLSYIMVLSLVLNVMIPFIALGEEDYQIQLEKVILKTKELFQISDGYKDFTSQISSYNNTTYFNMNWKDPDGILPTISVTSDQDGNIQSFNKYYSDIPEQETKLPKYSKEEALNIAKDFMIKVDSNMYNQMLFDEKGYYSSTWDTNYNFNYFRRVNGIIFRENNISISVSKITGEVMNYYSNWERELTFPRTTGIISLEEAKIAFKEKIGLELIYKGSNFYPRPLDVDGEEIQYYLAYVIRSPYYGIDAKTGEAVEIPYYRPYLEGGGDDRAASEEAAPAPVITPEERTEIEKLKDLITKESAEKIGREKLSLDDTFILRNINLYSMWRNKDEYQWNMYFVKELEENKMTSADITIDAKTGEVLNFYKGYEFKETDKAAITKVQAQEIAKDYLRSTNSNIYDNLTLREDKYQKDGDLTFYFTFERYEKGIYVENDGISVGINAVSKEIFSYSKTWYKGTLPSAEKVVDIEKAYDVLFEKVGYSLVYKLYYEYDSVGMETRSIKLIYGLNDSIPVIIDGNTGELLDYSGKPYVDKKDISYIDIESSYAREKILTLAEYRIGFYGENFRPKDKIIQKEFMFFLWKAINPYRNEGEDQIDIIYEELKNSRIIQDKEVNQTRVLTKEEAVKYVIRAMNYGRIAEIPNIYSDMFPDSKSIQEGMKGYVNLAYGLGIIVGDGSGLIKPLYELKREDAASIIYNYVFK